MGKTVGGILSLQVDGRTFPAKGSWTYDLGGDTREAVVGADRVHGYKEQPKVSYIEGTLSDLDDLDVTDLAKARDVTVVMELRNGKAVVLRDAWAAGDWNVTTEESEVTARFEGFSGELVTL